ncbi:hypothetical protein MTR67_052342, partial [Solanum verrucosum]
DLATCPSSVLSPFSSCLHHLHVLGHWVGFTYWNKGQSLSYRQITNGAWRCSCFSFFVLFNFFVPFCA